MISRLRVVIVDDQDLVRAGFAALLRDADDLEIVGEAQQGEEAVRLARTARPDVVLMDVRMPVLDGIAATTQIKNEPSCTHTKIIMLTTFGLDEYVFGALRAGAVGFLLKDIPPEELLKAIRIAASGDALLSPSITRRLIEIFASTPPLSPAPRITQPALTDREQDILYLVAQGLSNVDIAARLHACTSARRPSKRMSAASWQNSAPPHVCIL